MIATIFQWWRRRQRQVDIDILWPLCRDCASNLHDAHGAFFIHCMLDKTWIQDFSEEEIIAIIEELK